MKRSRDHRLRDLPAELERWRLLEAADVSEELRDLASQTCAAELASRDALASRLTAVVTFSGALLTVAVTVGRQAAEQELHPAGRVIVSICFTFGVALLVGALARCLAAARPRSRPLANPALLRYYAVNGIDDAEIRADTFKRAGATLEAVSAWNGSLARAVRDSVVLVAVALLAAAVAAVTIYYSTPW